MTSYSLVGNSLYTRDILGARNRNVDDIQTQLNTNKKYIDLKEYGVDRFRLLNFTNETQNRKAYSDGLNNSKSVHQVTIKTLDSINELAQEFRGTTTINNGEILPHNANKEYVTNFFNQLTDFLNTRYGDRFLFAGKSYTEAPVRDLKTLPTLDVSVLQTSNYEYLAFNSKPEITDAQGRVLGRLTPHFRSNFQFNTPEQASEFVQNTDPTRTEFASDVFSYYNNFKDTKAATTAATLPNGTVVTALRTELLDAQNVPVVDPNIFADGSLVWNRNSSAFDLQRTDEFLTRPDIRANENYYTEYGYNASEISIQQLVYAAINYNTALNGKNADGTQFDTDTKKQFIERANEYATKAIEGLRLDRARLSADIERLDNYKDLHDAFNSVLQNSINDIEQVNVPQLITSLSNLNTLLQESYFTIKVQQTLFLTSYFK